MVHDGFKMLQSISPTNLMVPRSIYRSLKKLLLLFFDGEIVHVRDGCGWAIKISIFVSIFVVAVSLIQLNSREFFVMNSLYY